MEDVVPESEAMRVLERARREYAEPFPVMAFPIRGGGWWPLYEDRIAGFQEAFPTMDIEGECRVAWAWVDANDERRKTARGMPRFLTAWFTRARE